MDRQAKTFLAVFTLMGSTFLTMNHIVKEDPIEAWWLAGVLFFISMVFWAWLLSESDEIAEASAMIVAPEAETALPRAQEWIISKELVAEIQQEAEQQAIQDPAAGVPAVEEEPAGEDQPETMEEPDAVEPPPIETPINTAGDEREAITEDVVENGDEADVVQDAAEDDPVAEAEIAEAEAAKPEGDAERTAEVIAEETAGDEPTTQEPSAQEPEEFKDTVEEPDDLTRVEGIGPKYRDALIEAGVTSYERLANLSVEEIETLAQDAGMRRSASMETWPEQARLAANNDWDGLDNLQEQLSGGRRD